MKYITTEIIAMVAALIVLTIVLTPLGVFFGWVMGHIVNWFAGDFVARGLTVLLGRDIGREMIPLIGGTLGFIGSFFKVHQASKRD